MINSDKTGSRWGARDLAWLALALLVVAVPVRAEFEAGVYLGAQAAGSSSVTGTGPGDLGPIDGRIDWQGRSDEAPIYYGFRFTRWSDNDLGVGIEFTHAKAVAEPGGRDALGFERLELTHGLNFLTLNVARRWSAASGRLVPFVSAGAGAAIPHVDILVAGDRTLEYQLTGPAVQVGAGVFWRVSSRWQLLAEYKGTYSWHDIDFAGGGAIETNIDTHALNLGAAVFW